MCNMTKEVILKSGATLLLLFNVLNHIVSWQKVRYVLSTLIKSVQFYPVVRECIFPHIDGCVSCPGRRKDTE